VRSDRYQLGALLTLRSVVDNLNDALDQFQSTLSQDQKTHLQNISSIPDANAVITFTMRLDSDNAKRKSRCVASRLHTLLESVQQFSVIVDTFVSSDPRVAALVWGSIKLALLVSLLLDALIY